MENINSVSVELIRNQRFVFGEPPKVRTLRFAEVLAEYYFDFIEDVLPKNKTCFAI